MCLRGNEVREMPLFHCKHTSVDTEVNEREESATFHLIIKNKAGQILFFVFFIEFYKKNKI